MGGRAAVVVGLASAISACHSAAGDPRQGPTASAVASAAPVAGHVQVVAVRVPNDLPAFYLRGRPGTRGRLVFLHGRCAHAQGYVQAFQFAVAARGTLVAPQGDAPCSGPFRSWTVDAERQNGRIAAAFRAAGDQAPLADVTIIGYSQGEYLAELLVERFPDRYTRAVLMGAPHTPAVGRLHKLRAAVMVSGELDDRELMKEGARRLETAGVPTTYLEMPGAPHGAIVEGERIMDQALAWLESHERR